MSDGAKLLRGIFWFLVLILISFWISFLCYPFYLLFGIFSACIPDCKGVVDILLKGVQFPHTCSKNMVNMAPYDAI